MGSYETDIHHATDKNDYSNQTEVVATDVEDITAVLYIVCRRKLTLQILMAVPMGRLDIRNPFVQWLDGIGMQLNEVI